MLEISYRYISLWLCKLIGRIRRFVTHKFVLNILSITLIMGALWLLEYRVQILNHTHTVLYNVYADLKQRFSDDAGEPNSSAQNNSTPASEVKATSSANNKARQTVSTQASLLTITNVLAVWALGLIIFWVIKARRTLVIGQFDDLTEGKASINPNGFGVLLLQRISDLSDLFSQYAQGRGAIPTVPQALEPVNASIQTETISQFIESAVTTESNVSLGPFKIPLGFMLGIIGKMVRGPRVTGQIHLVGGKRIVTAQLIGSLGARIWKIEELLDNDKHATDIAGDLGCMLFSHLALDNTVSWLGLKHYAAALSAFRLSTKTKISHRLNLKNAEHDLLQAVAQDPSFDLAYYNLGVVYTELNLLDAAGIAFDKTIQINNQRWSSYYALGHNRYIRGLDVETNNLSSLSDQDRQRLFIEASQHYLKGLDHFERAYRLAPSLFEKAQALNMKALCYLKLGSTDIYNAGRTARRAYIAAWWSLCECERTCGGHTVEQKRIREQTYSFVSLCLWNLSQYVVFDINSNKHLDLPLTQQGHPDLAAIAKLKTSNTSLQKYILRKTIKYLLMARKLTPSVADIHQNLGIIYLQYGRYRHAIESLYTCARVEPSSAKPWGYLAYAYAKYNKELQVLNAFYRVLDNLNTSDNEGLEFSIKAFAALHENVLRTKKFVESVQTKKTNPLSRLSRLLLLTWFMPRFFATAYRMTGHTWMNFGRQSQLLKNMILDPAQAQTIFAAKLNVWQVVSLRVYKLMTFSHDIKLLLNNNDADALDKRLQDEKKKGFDWECAVIEETLGRYYYQQQEYDKAIAHIDLAIDNFRYSHPDEVQRRGLYSYKAKILQSKREYSAALDAAKIGIAKDPIGSYERNELGWSYFNLAEYAAAIQAWQDALFWEPNDAEIHYNLGLAYYYQSWDTRNKELRKEKINTAAEYFKCAFELYHPGESRNKARYLMARCYFDAGHYTKALIELRALEKIGIYHDVVRLELADSLLSAGEYKQAETWFSTIAAELQAKLDEAKGDVNASIETSFISGVNNLGIALCYAHLGIASTLLDRDIQLDLASAEIKKAYQYLEKLTVKEDRDYWRSRCDIFKSKAELKQGKPEKAIAKLEAAIAADEDANTYYLLATALEQIIQKTKAENTKTLLKERFQNYCKQAEKKDWNDILKEELAELRKKLA